MVTRATAVVSRAAAGMLPPGCSARPAENAGVCATTESIATLHGHPLGTNALSGAGDRF